MRLHLGCGNHHIDSFVNVDIAYAPGVDVIDNAIYLRKFQSNTVDLIYACNILEHLGRWNYPIALRRWHDLLKPGGILRLSVPNFAAICDYYIQTQDLKTLYCALYAGQDSPQNIHYWAWDFDLLREDLETAGFGNVHCYDRNKTEHAHIRDWSLNFAPYCDQYGNQLPDTEWFEGINIALNVEAIKLDKS